MFSVGYGVQNRVNKIRDISQDDPTTATILAAVHFEWMLKRTILKLGCSPTAALRNELEKTYKLAIPNEKKKDYRSIWKREVAIRFKKSALGDVLGNLHTLQNSTMKVRGRVIHGNGTVAEEVAYKAIDEFIKSGEKLDSFVKKHGENLDEKLKARKKPRELDR